MNRKMSTEDIEKKFEQKLAALKKCQDDVEETLDMRRQLDVLMVENKIVKEELALLKPSGEVFKMVGPVLMRQDRQVAQDNVDKRLDFIVNEIKKLDDHTQLLDTQGRECKEQLDKLQQWYSKKQHAKQTKK